MAELVTPNTPRPSPYSEGRSGSGSGFGTTMNLYDRFKVEQAQQQALQETRQRPEYDDIPNTSTSSH